MAKGDKKKVQNTVDYQSNLSQNHLNNLRDSFVPQNQAAQNDYRGAVGDAQNDYRSIMDQYRNFQTTAASPISAERVNYSRSPEIAKALAGYGNFADTGGYSQDDITNMRARGISPIRSIYQNSINELARQKNLQGGYAPNHAAAMTKMRAGTSQQIADQVQNVNAMLAEAINRGKLEGLGGLSQVGLADSEMANRMAMFNAENAMQAGMFNRQTVDPMRLSAIQGQASLFGQTPGMASMFANQLNQSNQDLLNVQNQQMGLGQQRIGGQVQAAQTPSNFETGLGRVAQIGNMAANFASPFMMGGPSALTQIGGRAPTNINAGAMNTLGKYPGVRPTSVWG